MSKDRSSSPDSPFVRRFRRTSDRLNDLKARLQDRLLTIHRSDHLVVAQRGRPAEQHELVVASYNIHKCVGMDRRFDPMRIIHVIAEMDADVVAIQEADERFGRRRGLLDLPALEKHTGLRLLQASLAEQGHGWHGNALLLRKGRARTVRRLALPGAEPRGALVADLELPSGELRLVAAHLGLLRQSRRWQLRTIMDAIEEGPRMPTLLVGDLNEWRPGRRSSLHALQPMFGRLPGGLLSFPSYFPVMALDRAIGSPGLLTSLEVHDTPLAQIASDHLPIKAHIDIEAAGRSLSGAAA
ncbi:MAG: endonuclease/exonuclease/phosphatase family protein [Rhizobiaceae bacterium]